MQKVPITENFVLPELQIINKNQNSTQLILIDAQQSKLYLLHQYYCPNPTDYKQLITLLENQAIEGNDTPYVLNPLIYLPIKFTNQQMQTSHFVQVVYEYGSHTLSQELFLRIQQKNYFQEHEIWSILGSCILGLKHLQQKQLWHNSVCLNDIFVTQEGNIKLCHPMFRTYDHESSIGHELDYISRTISQGYFFSPEQITNTTQFQQTSLPNTQKFYLKSDIFSLAVTILSLCRLKVLNQFYVQIKTKYSYQIYIDSEIIEDAFNMLTGTYSENLLELLEKMLAYEVEERVGIDELAGVIIGLIDAKQKEEEMGRQRNLGIQYNDQSLINRQSRSYSKNQRNINSNNTNQKLSRVSQASQLSARTPKNINKSLYISEKEPDPEDKPSPVPFQCQRDIQTPETVQPQPLDLNQSNMSNQTLLNYINNEQSHKMANNQDEQHNNPNEKPLKQAHSILMTSKNLGSLSDDTSSIVIERHYIPQPNLEQNKQNICNSSQNIVNAHNQYLQLNLHKIQADQLNKQKDVKFIYSQLNMPNTEIYAYQKMGVRSARVYDNKGKSQHCQPFTKVVFNRHQNQSYRQSVYVPGCHSSYLSQPSSARNIQNLPKTRDNNYQRFYNSQEANMIYTDPLLLQAIRQDMDKIMKKRRITVTMSKEAQQLSRISEQMKQKAAKQYLTVYHHYNNNNKNIIQIENRPQTIKKMR